ncbi:hypothetical protein AAFX60_020440 [Aliivibrio fischeri]
MKFIKLISWFVLPLSLSVLANDVSDDNAAVSRSNSVITQQQGSSLVAALTNDYNETPDYCGNGSPAFLCSGITFRGNKPGNYHVWNPSPNAINTGGVSFSYLRKDSKYTRLAYGYDSGYIIYQIFGAPQGKRDLDYLCSSLSMQIQTVVIIMVVERMLIIRVLAVLVTNKIFIQHQSGNHIIMIRMAISTITNVRLT